jgi:hypothetical protein
MDCVSCGLTIDPDDPWWAVYAWDAFESKILEAMALHRACFEAGETIPTGEWQNDENDNPIYVDTGMQTRLLRASGEGMYIWSVNPDTGEGFLAPYVAARRMGDG